MDGCPKDRKRGKFLARRKEKILTREASCVSPPISHCRPCHEPTIGFTSNPQTARKINILLSIHPCQASSNDKSRNKKLRHGKLFIPKRNKIYPEKTNKTNKMSRKADLDEAERGTSRPSYPAPSSSSSLQAANPRRGSLRVQKGMEKRTSCTHTEKERGRQSIYCSELLTTELTSRLNTTTTVLRSIRRSKPSVPRAREVTRQVSSPPFSWRTEAEQSRRAALGSESRYMYGATRTWLLSLGKKEEQ